jgi:hypothetical protein
MLKTTVIAHFGTQTAVARALGITKGAISLWGDVIPEGRAYQVQAVTGGKLRVDAALYPKRTRLTRR